MTSALTGHTRITETNTADASTVFTVGSAATKGSIKTENL